jgi:hypothetical protein
VDTEGELKIFFSTVRAGLPKVPKEGALPGPLITWIHARGCKHAKNKNVEEPADPSPFSTRVNATSMAPGLKSMAPAKHAKA